MSIEDDSGLWQSPNLGATNESGLAFLPAGAYNHTIDAFGGINTYVYLLSTTLYDDTSCYIRILGYENSGVLYGNTGLGEGHSIRCLSDELSNTTIHVPEDFPTIQQLPINLIYLLHLHQQLIDVVRRPPTEACDNYGTL